MLDRNGRRHDLDWLRIGATLLLFPFHVAKVFDVLPIYHLKNRELVPALDFFTAFVHQWHMPLFFALAGWSAHASLAGRGARAFLRERVRRLVLPFTTGVILLCPIIKYLELRSGLSITATGAAALTQPFAESFVAFLPTFFTRVDRFTWSHLWFLLYLFTFSVLFTPLLTLLMQDGHRRLARASTLGLYLPLVPLVLIQTTLRLRWPGVQNLYDDWANVSYYSLFFLLGFALARWPAWEDVVAREWRRAGGLGLGASVTLGAAWLALGAVGSRALAGRPLALILTLQALTAVAGYGLGVALCGLARRHLAYDGPARAYLAEATLPIYILHQLAIVLPGFFIVRTSAAVAVKLGLLLATSITLTFVAYHCGVRRSPALAAALGSRTRGNPQRAPSTRTEDLRLNPPASPITGSTTFKTLLTKPCMKK
jgi:fucose 4-O-acetylase-like acetyltransferase